MICVQTILQAGRFPACFYIRVWKDFKVLATKNAAIVFTYSSILSSFLNSLFVSICNTQNPPDFRTVTSWPDTEF